MLKWHLFEKDGNPPEGMPVICLRNNNDLDTKEVYGYSEFHMVFESWFDFCRTDAFIAWASFNTISEEERNGI